MDRHENWKSNWSSTTPSDVDWKKRWWSEVWSANKIVVDAHVDRKPTENERTRLCVQNKAEITRLNKKVLKLTKDLEEVNQERDLLKHSLKNVEAASKRTSMVNW